MPRGGAREGAGRKPLAGTEAANSIFVRVTPDVHELVKRVARERGMPVSAWVRELIEKAIAEKNIQ